MESTGLITFLIIGGIAGWLAGKFTKGKGFGLLTNIVVGIVGAIVGGYVFGFFGINFGGFIGSIVTATAGAVILLALIKVIKKA